MTNGAFRPAPASLRQLALGSGQVDIWSTFLDEIGDIHPATGIHSILSEEERRRHRRFVFEKDRRRFLVTRLLVRYALSHYASIEPQDWRFGQSAFGRPSIANADPTARRLSFNVSHSGQVVLLAVACDRRLGVDVEDLRRTVSLDIARCHFTRAETLQLQTLPREAAARSFLDLWTLKESYVKACGKGLSIPLDEIGFELGKDKRLQAHFKRAPDGSEEAWKFLQWQPSATSIAALCVENSPVPAQHIRLWRAIPFEKVESARAEILRESPSSAGLATITE